jgi:hypothetical protein
MISEEVKYSRFVFQDILNKSDHQAVLQLANLVAGKYVFTLTVADAEGLSSSDKASILVKPGKILKRVLQCRKHWGVHGPVVKVIDFKPLAP